MKKIISVMMVVLLLNLNLIFAHGHDFNESKQLIDSGIGCDQLTEEQLEAMGDYYMEQMHPGEAHELMDQMMGGEGSDSLKQVHINMAKMLYCKDTSMGSGIMGSGGMMGGGMMNMMMGNNQMGSGGMGMMGQTGSMMSGWGSSYWNIMNVLLIILIVGLIILVYLWIVKVWKSMRSKV